MSLESKRKARINQIEKDLDKELNQGRDIEYQDFVMDVSANLEVSWRKAREYVDLAMRKLKLETKKINEQKLIRPK